MLMKQRGQRQPSASRFAVVQVASTYLICLPPETSIKSIRCFETNTYRNHTLFGT